jgi:hypothetical protein
LFILKNVDDEITTSYRIDSFTNRDAFLNYWNNNKCLLNINLNKKNDGYTLTTRDLSPLRENINHHLSNKEIGIIGIFKKKKYLNKKTFF